MALGAALVFLTLRLPSQPGQKGDSADDGNGAHFDVLGTVLIFTTIALPLFALNTGGSILPWSHPAVIALLVCTPLAAAACYWSQTRNAATPLIRVEVFKNPAVIVLITCVFFLVYSFNAVRQLLFEPNSPAICLC
jgi:hypothetical protein